MPCCQVIKFAQKASADAAGSSSVVASCPVIQSLKTIPEENAEERHHPILKKNGLALPIDLSPLSGDLVEGFPRLRPLDFLDYMAKSGNLHRLLGGRQVRGARKLLEDFWSNYKFIHPDFELFSIQNVDYGLCVPIYIHADGGRGYKKSEFMVASWSSVIGSGTGKACGKDHLVRSKRRFKSSKQKDTDPAQINLLGHSFGTHYLYTVMPAQWHKDDSFFQQVLTEMAKDLRTCFDEGVSIPGGGRLKLVVLGLKADLKFQARAGKLTRWYSTCRKAPIDHKRKKTTAGLCCWLCPAGAEEFPFEEVASESPAWFRAMPSWTDVPPWDEPCGLVRESFKYTSHEAKFFLGDLFHVYLAGFGQDWAGSCLVYMLGTIFQGSSVDNQLDALNLSWKLWRKMFHVCAHTYNFNRAMLNFPDATKTYPTGTWSKASDTPKILKFVLYVLDLYPERVSGDKFLYYIQVGCQSIGSCMETLYKSDLWIDSCPYESKYKLY